MTLSGGVKGERYIGKSVRRQGATSTKSEINMCSPGYKVSDSMDKRRIIGIKLQLQNYFANFIGHAYL